jgi:Protein of unknown function (DUF3579)
MTKQETKLETRQETKPATQHKEIIIQGLTLAGKQFRPSDWVDRMCSTFATFGDDKKLRYSPYLKPEVKNGVRCLAVDLKLKVSNPEGFEQLMQFAEENQLSITDTDGNSLNAPPPVAEAAAEKASSAKSA